MGAVVVSLAVSTALTLSPTIAAVAAAPMCRGERATIVVGPSEGGTGTRGDDVIVVRGAAEVSAGKGDDLICTSGGDSRGPNATVEGGPGDDVVIAGPAGGSFSLGPGDDRLIGGAGSDVVFPGAGRDSVATRGGRDSVYYSEGRDLVRLGPGGDFAYLAGGDGSTYGGGGGSDLLVPRMYGSTLDWWLDVDAGAFGTAAISTGFASFESYSLERNVHDLVFRGSPAADLVYVARRFSSTGRVRFLLGRGDDTINQVAVGAQYPSLDMRVSAGPGHDTFDVADLDADIDGDGDGDSDGRRDVHVALRTPTSGHLDIEGPTSETARVDLSFAGLEHLTDSGGGDVSFTGSDGPDTFTVRSGCQVSLDGGAGDDVLTGMTYPFFAECAGAQLSGGPGDDRLVGGNRDDVLIGGDGDDTADGGRGTDVCDAEVRIRCELDDPPEQGRAAWLGQLR